MGDEGRPDGHAIHECQPSNSGPCYEVEEFVLLHIAPANRCLEANRFRPAVTVDADGVDVTVVADLTGWLRSVRHHGS